MNKEDILAKSREDNKNADERELQVRLRANNIAKAIGVAVAFLLVFVEGVFLNRPEIGWTAMTIAFAMNTLETWIVFFATKKKTEIFTLILNPAILVGSILMLIKVLL